MEIVWLHGYPISTSLNKGTQFTSNFLEKLNEELSTNLDLSIIFHTQTDGKFDRIIQELEYILHACVIDLRGHWD